MPGLELHLERLMSASPDRVFRACVEAESLAAWWGPSGFTSTVEALDVNVAGGYRIAMEPPDPDDRETLVSLTFAAEAEGTLVALDQGPFATDARYELHRVGWTETLERLARFLA